MVVVVAVAVVAVVVVLVVLVLVLVLVLLVGRCWERVVGGGDGGGGGAAGAAAGAGAGDAVAYAPAAGTGGPDTAGQLATRHVHTVEYGPRARTCPVQWPPFRQAAHPGARGAESRNRNVGNMEGQDKPLFFFSFFR